MRKVVKKTQPSKEICLKALIDIKQWQRIQDNFSAITNVGLRILDTNAQEITKPSGEPRLCSVLLKNSSLKGSVCGPCLPTFLGGDALVDKNLSTVCKLVLHNFIVPLRVDFLVLGYLIMGPVILVARKPKEEYRKAADELSLRIDDLWSALLEIKVLSFHTAQSIMELVKDVAEYMLRTSYESTVRAKTIIMQESEKIDKLLNELLAVALQVSGANIGSIMLLNKKEKELSIKTAKGIPDNIVRNTRVKIGEGISGTAAEQGRSFLLDDNMPENRIKRYLNRPSLNSSMVVPIKVRDNVFGVINLGISKPSEVKFNAENLDLISRLVGLSTVAL